MNHDDPVSLTPPPAGYTEWLGDIKTQIHEAQQRTAQALNLQLVSLYWNIGRAILDQQEQQGWGAKIIDRLAQDLRTNFPEMKGFSPRNLKYMRAFAEEWPDAGNCAPAAAQIETERNSPTTVGSFVQAALHKLPWYHQSSLPSIEKIERKRADASET